MTPTPAESSPGRTLYPSPPLIYRPCELSSGARALTLRDGGLLVRLDRDYSGITVKISKDGEARKSFSGLRDMREVLDKVRTVAENYRRSRRSWWAVVPADQYSFTKFL